MTKFTLSVLIALSALSCGTASSAPIQSALAPAEASAQHPLIFSAPSPPIGIYRLDDNRCGVSAPDGKWYEEAGILRPIHAYFPCPQCDCECHPSHCDGSRLILVTNTDGTIESIPEVWPDQPLKTEPERPPEKPDETHDDQ